MTEQTKDITTWGDLHAETQAFEADLAKFSKTTLVIYLANITISRAWFTHGTREALAEARARLLADLKEWNKSGQMVNRNRRVESALKRFREISDAIASGKPLPKPKRKRRKTRKPVL